MKWVLLVILLSTSTFAYTGGFGIVPAASGGPSHPTTQAFQINTVTSNPQVINVNMNFVQRVDITTGSGRRGALVVREFPLGGTTAFSFTVPNPIQNDLVTADVYFWGPNSASLTVWHVHAGGTPYQETAQQVTPIQTDPNGNILWMMTVNSFSDFYVGEMPKREVPWLHIIMIALLAISACFLFKE